MIKIVRRNDRTVVFDDNGDQIFALYGPERKAEDRVLEWCVQWGERQWKAGVEFGKTVRSGEIAALLNIGDAVREAISGEAYGNLSTAQAESELFDDGDGPV